MFSQKKHPFNLVEYRGEMIELDEDLCELIPLMWNIGIETFFCCQGTPKYKDQTVWSGRRYRGYILMSHTPEAMNFIQELLMSFPAFQPNRKISWEISFDKLRPFGSRILIRFPNSDIPRLVKFIKETY